MGTANIKVSYYPADSVEEIDYQMAERSDIKQNEIAINNVVNLVAQAFADFGWDELDCIIDICFMKF